MDLLKNTKQASKEVIALLKRSSKETVSIRLSSESLDVLKNAIEALKRSESGMGKLTIPKYISALIEQHASNLRAK